MSNKEKNTENTVLLEATHLKKYFPVKKGIFARTKGWIKAVDDINFVVKERETFGLVGESGCGKSTTAKLSLLVETPTSGSVSFRGKDIAQFSKAERKIYRTSIQAVLQDPTSSLNPRQRVGTIISEPIVIQKQMDKREREARIVEVLDAVGMRAQHARLFPHEFSGGQRQRIAIARALSTNPKLIILDEPISSLDVSIRAQVMNLLLDIQEQFGLSYMLIAHDLSVILHMSTRVGVMYGGKIVETAESEELYKHAVHPYTQALFAAAFQNLNDKKMGEPILPGEVANPLNFPVGCRFHPRCPYSKPACRELAPELKMVTVGHEVACHL